MTSDTMTSQFIKLYDPDPALFPLSDIRMLRCDDNVCSFVSSDFLASPANMGNHGYGDFYRRKVYSIFKFTKEAHPLSYDKLKNLYDGCS